MEKMADYYFCQMMRVFGIILPMASHNKNERSEKFTCVFDFKDVNVMKFISGDMKKFMTMGSSIS